MDSMPEVSSAGFFDVLYGARFLERYGYLELRVLNGLKRPPFFCGSAEDAQAIAAEHGTNVYFGVMLRSERKGSRDCVAPFAFCAWADVDYGRQGHKRETHFATRDAALERIRKFPLQPSIIIDSGHGFHCYWLLIEPEKLESLDSIEKINRGLAKALKGDPAWDAARILRVPGTLNKKPNCPEVPCRIIEWHPERRYEWWDLREWADGSGGYKPMPVAFSVLEPALIELASLSLAAGLQELIQCGKQPRDRFPSRSEADMSVISSCVRAGLTNDQIRSVFADPRNGIGKKYRERGRTGDKYLAYTIGKARASADQKKPRSDLIGTALRADPGNVQHQPVDDKHLTDWGNAKRLVSRHGQDLRFCHAWGKWLFWDGTRWRGDDTGEVYRQAKDTIQQLFVEAASIADKELRDALIDHARRSESANRIRDMIRLAESEPGIPVTPEQWDANPWLLNVQNGILDLRTGQLRAHSREDLLTKLAPVVFDPHAFCPTWDAFLKTIMAGSPKLVGFLKRAVGYALTADVREQVLLFLYGTGANGKTTFLKTCHGMMGDYAKQAEPDLLIASKGDRHPTGVADLHGARFVATVEVGEGRRMAETLAKQLTGGDKVKARLMRQDFFEFDPTFKLFLAANHKPVVQGTDNGIWRRILLVPFTVVIPPKDQDKQLLDKLRAEWPGILRWAVEGCLEWQRDGLGIPEEVKAATEAYRAEMDIMADFLEECSVQLPGIRVEAWKLYEAYLEWAEKNGEAPLSRKRFGERMGEKGFRKEKRDRIWYLGIGLKSLPTPQPPKREDQEDLPDNPSRARVHEKVPYEPPNPPKGLFGQCAPQEASGAEEAPFGPTGSKPDQSALFGPEEVSPWTV